MSGFNRELREFEGKHKCVCVQVISVQGFKDSIDEDWDTFDRVKIESYSDEDIYIEMKKYGWMEGMDELEIYHDLATELELYKDNE